MYAVFGDINHQESVYNFGSRELCYPFFRTPQGTVGENRSYYTSRYADRVKQEFQTGKTQCQTMGKPFIPLNSPTDFLRKNSGLAVSLTNRRLSSKEQLSCRRKASSDSMNKSPCGGAQSPCGNNENALTNPDPCEQGNQCSNSNNDCENPQKSFPSGEFTTIPQEARDYIYENICKVINQPARIPPARLVDNVRGGAKNWRGSGLDRQYVHRRDFGQVPEYLEKRRQELQEQKSQKMVKETGMPENPPPCRHLLEEERISLIEGLKNKWEFLFKEFQSIPLSANSTLRVKQKEQLEASLKDIEKDIRLLESHNHIFIGDELPGNSRPLYLGD